MQRMQMKENLPYFLPADEREITIYMNRDRKKKSCQKLTKLYAKSILLFGWLVNISWLNLIKLG